MISGATRYAAGFVLWGALGAAALAQAASAERRIPIERARAAAAPAHNHEADKHDMICQGGPEGLADIELIPDAVISQRGRERIEYHAELVVKRGKRLGIAWHADIINDRGQVIVDGIYTGQDAKGAGDTALTGAISAEVPDGFYAVRARAAVAADGEPSDILEAVQHVEVRGGKWAELTDAQWLKYSRAGEGFTEDEVRKMGLLP